jgi:hypothetical protein
MGRFFMISCTLALGACGNDHAPGSSADAAAPEIDANICPGALESCSGACVNLTNDPGNCGSCDRACTPAAGCASSQCVCPGAFLTASPPVLATEMITPPTGYVTGVAAVTGSDLQEHAVVVTSAVTAPLHAALSVTGGQVAVAIEYDVVSATQARSTYLATAGSVTLSRRCAAGIAGALADVTLVEIDPRTLQPIAGGCAASVSQLEFDIAQPCS